MKLYVKQETFSWMGKFNVKDAKGANRYFVEGQLSHDGHVLHIFDMDKKEVAYIRNKLSGLRPRVEIHQNGKVSVEVLKKRAGLKTVYVINGSDWTIRGDFRTHDYALSGGYGNALAVRIVPQEACDNYELDISNTADEVKVLATALTLDCVLEGVK
jgi:uncharacterized protein YxjI